MLDQEANRSESSKKMWGQTVKALNATLDFRLYASGIGGGGEGGVIKPFKAVMSVLRKVPFRKI